MLEKHPKVHQKNTYVLNHSRVDSTDPFKLTVSLHDSLKQCLDKNLLVRCSNTPGAPIKVHLNPDSVDLTLKNGQIRSGWNFWKAKKILVGTLQVQNLAPGKIFFCGGIAVKSLAFFL